MAATYPKTGSILNSQLVRLINSNINFSEQRGRGSGADLFRIARKRC